MQIKTKLMFHLISEWQLSRKETITNAGKNGGGG
jgi:hypothetical protein